MSHVTAAPVATLFVASAPYCLSNSSIFLPNIALSPASHAISVSLMLLSSWSIVYVLILPRRFLVMSQPRLSFASDDTSEIQFVLSRILSCAILYPSTSSCLNLFHIAGSCSVLIFQYPFFSSTFFIIDSAIHDLAGFSTSLFAVPSSIPTDNALLLKSLLLHGMISYEVLNHSEESRFLTACDLNIGSVVTYLPISFGVASIFTHVLSPVEAACAVRDNVLNAI